MKFYRFLFLLAPLYLFSCKSIEKTRNYVEDLKVDSIGKDTVKIPEWRIQKNDLLSIQISSLSIIPEKSDVIFNQPTVGLSTSGSGGDGGMIMGYLVDLNGNITHHRLGVIRAEGLTKQELASEITKRLTTPVELLKDPTVSIRLLNFKVTVLGEVNSPGDIKVQGERITILQAIGLAGDFNQYGKKYTLKIVREQNGQREFGSIDLSTKELFNSPYYHLLQNDVVFVEPTKQKAKQLDQQVVASRITFALSIITAAAFIYNLFK